MVDEFTHPQRKLVKELNDAQFAFDVNEMDEEFEVRRDTFLVNSDELTEEEKGVLAVDM